jgi:transposase
LQKGVSIEEIIKDTSYARSSIYAIQKTAKARGYDPSKDTRILLSYVEDAPRTGRPKKCTSDVEEQVIKAISQNSTTRELSTQKITDTLTPLIKGGISARSIHRILRHRGYKPCKPTRKPGLTQANKLKRLKWCLDHEHWTLDDWKKVIWSDETSVTWGGQRGRVRVWRTKDEAYNHHCIRRRWKGFKQFMFWGCFSYDEKGPCHIWEDETAKEKEEAIEWLKAKNAELEPLRKQAWELETALRRLNIQRNPGGRKPQWRWCKRTGKLEREKSKGGIDWYRYYKTILKKKLLPFAKKCEQVLPGIIVQEDNASPHVHHYQATVYDFWKVLKLLWPANSPDLNAIEPAWYWMKKQTTKHGVAMGVEQMKKDWIAAWKKLPQSLIQKWIKRIPEHIKQIIKCRGGNEYREGLGSKRRNPDRVRP